MNVCVSSLYTLYCIYTYAQSHTLLGVFLGFY